MRVLALRPPGIAAEGFPAGVAGSTVSLSRLRWWSGAVAGARTSPLQVALHDPRRLELAIRREMESFRPDVAVFVLSRLGRSALRWTDKVPVVVDFVDSLALNMRAKAGSGGGPLSALWRWEGRRMAAWDRHVLEQVHAGMVVSGRDRTALLGTADDLAERLEVVPFGVEIQKLDPGEAATSPAQGLGPQMDRPRIGRPVVLLAGNLGYFPTRDGAAWFAETVWPRIRARAPEVEWWLAGSRIPKALNSLDGTDGIRVLDTPPDLHQIRRRAAVSVAPLKGGSGTPIKILEAMADGVPVVATHEAAEGLEETRGGELSLADTPEAFAEEILRLLERPTEAVQQTALAGEWLRSRHGLPAVTCRFEQVLDVARERFQERAVQSSASPLKRPGPSA